MGHPVTAFVLYAVIIPVSHLTSWYNLTLEHENVHNAEHLAFLVVGYLFWRQIFGSDPNKYRLHPALQLFYLFMAIPIDTFTGLSLAGPATSSSRPTSPPTEPGVPPTSPTSTSAATSCGSSATPSCCGR